MYFDRKYQGILTIQITQCYFVFEKYILKNVYWKYSPSLTKWILTLTTLIKNNDLTEI